MDLIERYVNEVGRKLPRKGRADIKAELNSTLRDMAEDKYGDSPSEDELVKLLREFGSPSEIATSFQPSNSYLIGPELYPYFRIVVGAVLLALTIGLSLAFIVSVIFGSSDADAFLQNTLDWMVSLVQAYLSGFASVVLVFALLQYFGADVKDKEGDSKEAKAWDPRQLPDTREVDLVGRGESIAAVAVGVVFLFLINIFADDIGIVVSWGDRPLFTNILQDNLAWLNIAISLGVGLNLLLLIQGRWYIYTRFAKLGLDVFWIYIVYQIVQTIAAEQSAMVAAGLVEPLPTMFVGFGYVVLLGMSIALIVNFVKVMVNEVKRAVGNDLPAPELQ